MDNPLGDKIDNYTKIVKLVRELSATTLMFLLASYLAFVMVAEVRVLMPRIAQAVEQHAMLSAQRDNAVVTNTEELTRLARLQCQALKTLVRQDPAVCEIRTLRLGSTIVP
jgi:predicted lipid-binding transport protein (Tim44 family)